MRPSRAPIISPTFNETEQYTNVYEFSLEERVNSFSKNSKRNIETLIVGCVLGLSSMFVFFVLGNFCIRYNDGKLFALEQPDLDLSDFDDGLLIDFEAFDDSYSNPLVI